MNLKAKILAVDDEPFNLDILNDYLTDAGFDMVCVEDGMRALAELEKTRFDLLIIDRMMPQLDGIQLLQQIKSNPKYETLPVVMQTAAATPEQIVEGLRAGAYYYLTKPYNETVLGAIVVSALTQSRKLGQVAKNGFSEFDTTALLQNASFRFRTIEDVETLAPVVSSYFPDPRKTVFGLRELMLNAVEHGNLGITYAEKSRLVLAGTWTNEVHRRLRLPENEQKFASLAIEIRGSELAVTIRDQGRGFQWSDYLDFSPSRAADPNGRGIAMSRAVAFPSMMYSGSGNEVICYAPRIRRTSTRPPE